MTRKTDIAPEAAAYMERAGRHLGHMGNPKLSVLAIPLYERALAIEPDCVDIHIGLAMAYRALGRNQEALASCRKILQLAPGSLRAQFCVCMIQIPVCCDSSEEVLERRRAYQSHLEQLLAAAREADPAELREARDAVKKANPFFLLYQGCNDRHLQGMYGEIVSRIMTACFPRCAKPPSVSPPAPGEPIRVGIAFGFFHAHSAWKVVLKGWLAHLDKDRFQLIGYSLGDRTDEETKFARSCFSRCVEGKRPTREWISIIRKDRLHVLIYPEIGMKAKAVGLAALRLAPVQCASWGNYTTSGLPTIDYYLGSELCEPPDANDHYTEQLVRLPNLSIHYEPPNIAPDPLPREELGLRPSAVVYLCAQSLWKYMPQYDDVFPRIARAAGDCQFAFLRDKRWGTVTARFGRRLERAFAAHDLDWHDHVVFLPTLSDGGYHRLNQVSDIFLDSIRVSGGTTVLESLGYDLPIVTIPGEFLRGRVATALLKWMDVTETIATNVDEYVEIAARLATDPAWRQSISTRIAQNKHVIYKDMSCVQGLEDFLQTTADPGQSTGETGEEE